MRSATPPPEPSTQDVAQSLFSKGIHPVPEAPVPEEPVAWFRVAGTVASDERTLLLARMVGEVLARSGYGLIHGGSPGVDQVAREAYLEACVGRPFLRMAIEPEWAVIVQPLDDEPVLGRDGPVSDREFLGGGLIALQGLGFGVLKLVARAQDAGIPVIPVAISGPQPREMLGDILASWPPAWGADVDRAPWEDLRENFNPEILVTLLDQVRTARPIVRPTHATAVNDRADGADHLGVRAQVDRFARLIIAPGADATPLAIGLFGEWGSGKSFFLRNIQRRIVELTSLEARGKAGEPPTCGRVCQIEFNAWTYADANLWASLATRIFDQLAEVLTPVPGAGRAPNRVQLRHRLTERTREVEQARRDLEHRRHALEALDEAIRRESAALDGRRLGRAEAWKKALVEEGGEQAREAVQGAITWLGLEIDAQELVDEAAAAEIVSEARSVGGFLRRLPWVVWVLVVVGIAFPFILYRQLDEVGRFLVPLAEALVAGLALLRRIRRHAAEVATLARKARTLQSLVRKVCTPEVDPRILHDRDEKRKEWENAQANLAKLESVVEVTSRQIEDITSGRSVSDLVTRLAARDGTWHTHEGLVSQLRRDIEDLGALMDDHVSAVEEERKRRMEAKSPDPSWRPLPDPICRVVLYIDDLDRCPPAEVVRVLQAVHLLLALDRFIVVLAVDPRWLERALEHEYGALLGAVSSQLGRARATDWLEKVFQIPYTLPPIPPGGYLSMVRAFLPIDTGASEPTGSPQPVPPMGGGGAQRPAPDPSLRPIQPVGEPISLTIGPAEQRFLEELEGFIGTPRDLKRFINVYRLLRVSVPTPEYPAFVGGTHRVAQVLLAVLIGFPQVGCALLSYLCRPERLGAVPADWAGLCQILSRADESHPIVRHCAPDAETRAELARLLERLGRIQGDKLPSNLEIYRIWAGRVGPYSFHWRWS